MVTGNFLKYSLKISIQASNAYEQHFCYCNPQVFTYLHKISNAFKSNDLAGQITLNFDFFRVFVFQDTV